MARQISVFAGVLWVMAALCASAAPNGKARVVVMDQRMDVYGGTWAYDDKDVKVKGKVYHGRGGATLNPNDTMNLRGTFDIQGYDWFTCYVGVPDNLDIRGDLVSFSIDGYTTKDLNPIPNTPAERVLLKLTGHKTLSLRGACGFLEPKLYRGTAVPKEDESAGAAPAAGEGTEGASEGSAAGTPAAFGVKPEDLDQFAQALRKAVDGERDPQLKARLATARIALAPFAPIGKLSVDVKDVCENLATSLAEEHFRLVERAQLDRALKELKIQNGGLIDPKSAKQIGQVTGATFLLIGSVADRAQQVLINARLIETESGDVVLAKRGTAAKVRLTPAQ